MARLIIKELAERQNISQSRLQREAGVTMSQLRRYWYNQSESVVLDALERIAKVLGVKTGDLIADNDEAQPAK
ncbi:DNA-binding Xre family transcriptional regulator [Thermosporothrix hazakensis]|uniref:DNA-binding Xre family transcriptional regulator n=2 Tax=Thermosporothrix TaxID=768650 RepID=A0A326U8Y7_THEHA|nr:DNA-binding Xre family transcriptional regulator [Thermosporothrix hazakensis]